MSDTAKAKRKLQAALRRLDEAFLLLADIRELLPKFDPGLPADEQQHIARGCVQEAVRKLYDAKHSVESAHAAAGKTEAEIYPQTPVDDIYEVIEKQNDEALRR